MAGQGSSPGLGLADAAEAAAREFGDPEAGSLEGVAQQAQFPDGPGAPPPAEEAPAKDPRADEEYTFQFRFVDTRGRVWEGEFTNKALTRPQQRQAAAMEAGLNGNRPIGAMPPNMAVLNHMLAWMEVSLIKRPSWAAKLDEIRSDDLVSRLYGEVWGHQTYFCGDQD